MSHAIIIGGGAVGLGLAWELSRREFQVTLLERDEVGKATSWAAAGILPPANLATATDPIDRLRGLSHELFPAWTQELQDITGIDSGLRRCGGWYLANSPGEAAVMAGMADYWRELQIECEPIASTDVVDREPELAAWINANKNCAAWWVPDEYQLRSPRYLQALAAALSQDTTGRQPRVTIKPHFTVNGLETTPNSVSVIGSETGSTTTTQFNGDLVIVAAGAWTGTVAPELRLQQSIVPIRGQILQFKTDTPPLRAVVNIGHRYLVARDDGTVIIGSCEEEVGLQLGNTDEMLDTLRQFAHELCPTLSATTEVTAWSGLRPMTFDGFPMIGRVPDQPNVYIASGHFRSGLHLSPGTAVTLADLICNQPPRVDLDAFRVGKQQHSFHHPN